MKDLIGKNVSIICKDDLRYKGVLIDILDINFLCVRLVDREILINIFSIISLKEI